MNPRRRNLLTAGTLLALLPAARSWAGEPTEACAWSRFRTRFMQADGRIIDHAAQGISTSEGQAYALFHALVAGDRDSFERILAWSAANLAGGDLTARLMAWKWGQRPDKSWGVLDANAASDADLWLAHTLFEAARLWSVPAWRATAQLLQARIAHELVVDGGALGRLLLPGPQGFALDGGGWKLNPSYLPLPVLRGLEREVGDGVWAKVANSLPAMLAAAPHGLVPDWIEARPEKGFALPADAGGSYDAIRVYLWAGITAREEPLRRAVLERSAGMAACEARLLVPPEKIDAASGACSGAGPAGFSLALLPYLQALGRKEAQQRQAQRLEALGGVPGVYYQQALALFAQGWLDGRYRYERNGRLVLKKDTTCGK